MIRPVLFPDFDCILLLDLLGSIWVKDAHCSGQALGVEPIHAADGQNSFPGKVILGLLCEPKYNSRLGGGPC